MTAAHCHCDGANKTVTFGDSTRDPAARVVEVLRSEAWIRCDQDEREGDLALLFLKEDAPVTPRTLAAPEWIDKATEVHVVGFGRTNPLAADRDQARGGRAHRHHQLRRQGLVAGRSGRRRERLYACRSRGELVAGSPLLDRDSCNGDSGGPIFVKGPEDKLYLAGATSRAVVRFGLRPCGDGGIYARADGDGLAWMKAKGVSPTVGSATAGTGWVPTGGKQLARLSQEPPTPATAEAARATVNTWVRSHA